MGPVLFLLYINGYLNGLSCDAVMFADDVKIGRTIESPCDIQGRQNETQTSPRGPLYISILLNVSFLGCIFDRRRTILFSIN